MKRIIFLICFSILLSYHPNAQDYVPFPTSNAEWKINHFSIFGGNFTQRVVMSGDTMINNKTYQKIFSNNPYSTNTEDSLFYSLALREEEKKIYFVDNGTVEEHLLYDFTKEVGDSVTIFATFGNSTIVPITSKIDAIDSIQLIDGSYRKQYFFEWYNEYWIEGIGSTFKPLEPFDNISDNSYTLECFSDNEKLVYSLNSTSCDGFVNVSNPKNNNDIAVFPNPFQDNLTVINNSENSRIKNISIFDFLGRIFFKSENTNGKKMEFNLKNIPLGVYYLKINFEDDTFLIEKIIKY